MTYSIQHLGQFYQLRERWRTIDETFIEYIKLGFYIFQQKESKLKERLKNCSDESEYQDILGEEKDIANYFLLRTFLVGGMGYICAQFESYLLELEKQYCGEVPERKSDIIRQSRETICLKAGFDIRTHLDCFWMPLLDYKKIRNVFVHANGIVRRPSDLNTIMNYNDMLNNISNPGQLEIGLTVNFLLKVVKDMSSYYFALIQELDNLKQ